MLKGIDIILYEKTKTGEDAFHAPIYTETPVTVHNVLGKHALQRGHHLVKTGPGG